MLINESLQYKLFENAEGLVAREARVRGFCAFEDNRYEDEARTREIRICASSEPHPHTQCVMRWGERRDRPTKSVPVGLRQCEARSNPQLIQFTGKAYRKKR